jgi:hypothetical protein
MNATARATSETSPLDPVRTLCDAIAETHPPANAYEQMLLTQVARSWQRLERAYDAERRYFEGRDMAEIIRTKLDEFKAVTRYVTDCERAWRHATLNLEKAQRRRQRETKASSPPARRNAPPPAPDPSPRPSVPPPAPDPSPRPSVPPPVPDPAPRPSAQPVAAVHHAHRE